MYTCLSRHVAVLSRECFIESYVYLREKMIVTPNSNVIPGLFHYC